MQVIVSILKSKSNYNGLFKIDLDSETIIDSLVCTKSNLPIPEIEAEEYYGIKGIAFDGKRKISSKTSRKKISVSYKIPRLIYFATSRSILSTTDFVNIESVGINVGSAIHQIDYIRSGLAYCSTNENVVRYLDNTKPTFLYNGLSGIGIDINHINSLYETDDDIYFTYHNNHNAQPGMICSMNQGPIVRNLDKPHNVCVNHKSEIIVCDSFRLKVSKYDSQGTLIIDSPELQGYTRGLAISQDGIMIVGSSPREINLPVITILNNNFEIQKEMSLCTIDDKITGEIYDIRIISEIDLGLSMNFKHWGNQ